MKCFPRWFGPAGLMAVIVLAQVAVRGDDAVYLTPPKVVVDAFDASMQPVPIVSPARNVIALVRQNTMPSIRELAQPLLRLAGQRINPTTNNIHFSYRSPTVASLTLKSVADGAETPVALPAEGAFGAPRFAPDGSAIALARATSSGLELWMVNVPAGTVRKVTGPILNGTWGDPCEWFADSRALLCRTVPASRGAAPRAPDVPAGPKVQEHSGPAAPVRTNQDLLASAHDEALFDHYFTSQLAVVDATSGNARPTGTPAVFDLSIPSPDGRFILASRITRPYSRLVAAADFPRTLEILDTTGARVRLIGESPLAETVPIEGVRVGPRVPAWVPVKPATVTWVEALDEGNPARDVPFRDRVLELAAPFGGEPAERIRLASRFQELVWSTGGVGFASEYDRPRRWTRTWMLDGATAPRKLFDRSAEDRYNDPGVLVRRPVGQPVPEFGPLPDRVVVQQGDMVYLAGEGASAQGDRPFLTRLNVRTAKVDRLFQSPDGSYESLLALLSDDGRTFLTLRETPTSPANINLRKADTTVPRALTAVQDSIPALSGAQKQLLTFERKDGVKLSAILYVPAERKPGERLPAVVWAYPREFTAADTASQVTGSPYRYNGLSFGNLQALFLLQGYALLVPTMPIVGTGETANDTYVDQLVADAQAAVDKAVSLGVVDPQRIGVAGHSYGAFMTANLLAHSDIFRAGIALSGAYNRSLTPFGFQNERRTFWQQPDLYARMSPFWYAHQIKEPILLFHGEVDNNQGTFPIQTERFYMALKGHGATVRYVLLPHESHRYAARETLLHVAAESLQWFDRFVKNAPTGATSAGAF